jgi:TDG/mug DNA glycosylase family protein
MKVTHTLKSIYQKDSQILILGTMPSVISRANNFYYANPSNRFWPTLEAVFEVKLNSKEEKITFLKENKIALWDVIDSCDIDGSSDSSIKNIKLNDIKSLISQTNIKYIFCTGKLAYNLFNKNFFNENVYYLPNPSGANARENILTLKEKYQILKDCLK